MISPDPKDPVSPTPDALPRKRQRWVWLTAAVLVLAIAGAAAAAFFWLRPGESNWSKPAAQLLPTEVADNKVVANADSDALLTQLKELAPQVEGTTASIDTPAGAGAIKMAVLTGPRNSLNSIQLRIAESLGAGRAAAADPWEAGSINGSSSSNLSSKYEKSDFQLDGLRVDRVASVSESGSVTRQWLMVRPAQGLLLTVSDISGDEQQARDALSAMLDQAKG